MGVRLRLYGDVGWSLDGRASPVGGSARMCVLLALVEAQGHTVSVASLIDRLWVTPPDSGANAVQRHVSKLRRQLSELGVDEPRRVIETTRGGYRLGNAETDLELMRDWIGTQGADPCEVRWWEQPLIGAPWEPTQVLRNQLEQLAGLALGKWSLGLASTELASAAERCRHILTHTPASEAAGRVHEQVVSRMRDNNRMLLTPDALETLREVVGLWVDGSSSEALDKLDVPTPALPESLANHVGRAMIWLDPEEPWVRTCVLGLLETGVANPVQHERSLVSLASRVFEQRHDGRHAAKAEVSAAESEWDRLRALRVALMLGLSAPHDSAQDELVEHLGAIDHPDSRVEACRFRFLARLRRLELAESKDLLGEYEATVAREWVGTGDDFAPMAAAALQRSSDELIAEVFGPRQSRLGAFVSDRWVVQLADAIRQLVCGDAPVPDSEIHTIMLTSSESMIRATRLLQDLRAGVAVSDPAHELASELPTMVREKQFMAAPVALGLVAESLHDRELADAATKAMKPWAGQLLGLWPVDFCFGPADRWLDRLASV